ncbi:hypothetical protein [Undibacterium sp. TJN19]|uniref:hypothetical protein n=1 Tax=Undibacterium sp. TJN19 TaxID=3413055 RepID=UPI003BF2A98B
MGDLVQADKKLSLKSDFIAAAIIVFLLAQRHAGFMLVFVMLLSLPFLIFNLFVMMKNPGRRRFLRNKILLWIVAFGCIITWHSYLYVSSRKTANEVISLVQQYIAKNGHCPADIAVLGLSEDWLKNRLGLSHYYCKDGEPHFYYATTYLVFETEQYDFKNNVWWHRGS